MKDWPIKKLKNICKINPTKSEVKNVSDDVMVSFVPMSAVDEVTQQIERQESKRYGDVKKGYTYFRKGDILFAKITPCMENGKVALSNNLENEIGFASTEFHILRAGADVLPAFIFHLVKSKKFREEAEQKMTGSAGQKRVPKSFIEDYEIQLPPIEVQKKIVAKLESLLAKVSEAKRLRAEARKSADNLLSAELHKIFEEGKKKGWEEQELGDLYDITSSKRVFKSEWTESGVPFYRAREIVSLAKNKPFKTPIYISEELYETYKSKYGVPKEGDILVTGVGTLGISYLVRGEDKFYFKDGNIIWLKKKADVDSRFVEYFFESPVLKEQIEETSAGATVRTFTIQTAKKVKIPISALAEQKKIVARLNALSQKIEAVKELQDATENEFSILESSVLSKAFSGELIEEIVAIQKAVPSPYFRNQVNAAIIEQVRADGGSTTEVAVAKYNHLLQEICGVSLGYEFAESKFGPFDAKIKNLIWSGLGRNKWFAKSQGMIVKGQNINALISKRSNLYRSAQAAMAELSKLGITKLDTDRVELLSTVCHSIKQTVSVELKKVRDFMSTWQTNKNQTKAEKFSEEQTRKCLDFIVKNELHKKLI